MEPERAGTGAGRGGEVASGPGGRSERQTEPGWRAARDGAGGEGGEAVEKNEDLWRRAGGGGRWRSSFERGLVRPKFQNRSRV